MLTASSWMALAQTNFTQITNVVPVIDLFDGAGCAFVDYDNDGYVDLCVGNYSGNNRLYHNQHDGTFLAITNGAIVNEGANQSYGVAWGDFNNDGFPDLFVGNGYGSGRTNFLYRNNGNGTFTKITSGAIVSVSGNFAGCSWADYDHDGFLDLFVANDPAISGTSLLYHNNGDGTFSKVSSIVAVQSLALAGAWADFNNDGLPDLFVANGFNTSTPNFLYQNLGGGGFKRVSGTNFVSAARGSVGAAWGDYDNDGFLDVFVANYGQSNELYHNNGNGTFTRVTTGSIVNDPAQSISTAWGDYDNDGYLDLFVGNRNGTKNFLYHNNGDGTFTRVTSGPITEGNDENGGCAWGDYDNDGFLDLYVSNLGPNNGGPARAFLYHNTGNSNHWLKVKCVGVASNRMAIGAKVRVQTTINGVATWQLREMTTGDGFGSAALTAHFGLGDATNVDTVRVEWPSGGAQEIHRVGANQSLEIFEPPTLYAAGLGADGFHLQVVTSRALTDHRVESSPNLKDWTEVTTLNSQALGQRVPVVDTNAPGRDVTFYRVVWLDKGYLP
jgi:hypothetical protein